MQAENLVGRRRKEIASPPFLFLQLSHAYCMADKRREGEEARKRGLPLPINFLIPYEDAQPSMYRLDWFNKKTLL